MKYLLAARTAFLHRNFQNPTGATPPLRKLNYSIIEKKKLNKLVITLIIAILVITTILINRLIIAFTIITINN
jgi:hypothetical protein